MLYIISPVNFEQVFDCWLATWRTTLVNTQGIIHLVRTQKFPKNYDFLHPDTNTYVCISG